MAFKKILLLIILSFININAGAQIRVSGSFSSLSGQRVKLVGFKDFGIYTIDSTQVSSNGKFNLKFGQNNSGMAYLAGADNKAYFVVLDREDIDLKGDDFGRAESVIVLSGKENQRFAQYATENVKRERALAAWDYLTKIYKQDSLFSDQKLMMETIEKEKQRIKNEDRLFMERIEEDKYLNWYLPVRKLISSTSTIAQHRYEEIPSVIKAFRTIDYSDERIYKSGLLRESLENHFWLLENTTPSLDAAFLEMKTSIDVILATLQNNPKKCTKITEFLFDLFQNHSLYKAAEYLALQVLNDSSFKINEKVASKLESYRAVKIGNIAPDFKFKGDVISPAYSSGRVPKKLSDINAKHTVLIFGSSGCSACSDELLQISGLYSKWKEQGVEVIFVSLDTDAEVFKNFVDRFPFISVSDYKKWESPAVKNYHIFETPTIFLLDKNRKIILRPNDAKQLDSWIDFYLIKGNQ